MSKSGQRMVIAGLLALLAVGTAMFLLPGVPRSDSKHAPLLDKKSWGDYSERFIQSGRIVDHDNGGISHSEGQGYGLLLAEASGDQATFDRILTWTYDNLLREDGLFAWRWEPCPASDRTCVTDENNATDGELLIAWALLRAATRFNNPAYAAQAAGIANAVAEHLVTERHGTLILLPGMSGFTHGDTVTVNPSYWVFPALEELIRAFPEGPWRRLNEDGRSLLSRMFFGFYGLTPDWVDLDERGVRPSALFDPVYGFNAVRVPLHLAWAQRSLSLEDISPYLVFWDSFNPPPAWINLVDSTVAPYAWSGGMEAIAVFARARLERRHLGSADFPVPGSGDGYFSTSLILLSRIAAAERMN